MVRFPKVFLGFFLVAGLALASCDSPGGPDQTDGGESSAPGIVEPAPSGADGVGSDEEDDPATAGDDRPTAAQDNGGAVDSAAEMVTVSIYLMDDDCMSFSPQSVQVRASSPMRDAVAAVIERQEFAAFELSGYRVQLEDAQATVDLRLSADSDRQFVSLSSCEQQSLFGSLEETLTNNPDWQVEQVKFTNRGEDLVL